MLGNRAGSYEDNGMIYETYSQAGDAWGCCYPAPLECDSKLENNNASDKPLSKLEWAVAGILTTGAIIASVALTYISISEMIKNQIP